MQNAFSTGKANKVSGLIDRQEYLHLLIRTIQPTKAAQPVSIQSPHPQCKGLRKSSLVFCPSLDNFCQHTTKKRKDLLFSSCGGQRQQRLQYTGEKLTKKKTIIWRTKDIELVCSDHNPLKFFDLILPSFLSLHDFPLQCTTWKPNCSRSTDRVILVLFYSRLVTRKKTLYDPYNKSKIHISWSFSVFLELSLTLTRLVRLLHQHLWKFRWNS